ncbi:transposable element Tcb2 transposase [Trichonephila clavipes]|nr:transposable element Tcb2 transposase [Trichonephila clavipes]
MVSSRGNFPARQCSSANSKSCSRFPPSFSDSSMSGPLPRFVEHVWDQLKRQMPSCHSVHDLELAVQDLWAHLPQDIIRCLINSMLDRVATCIAAGGGPTCF